MDRRISSGKKGIKKGGKRRDSNGLPGRSKVRYEMKVSYENDKRIYAVLNISANKTLDDLCGMILDAFDFSDGHLYLFNFSGRGYGEGEDIYCFMPEFAEKGTDIALGNLNLSPKQKFYLLYDFGDDWGFDIQVQNIYESEESVIDGIVSVKGKLEQYPVCPDEEPGFGENDWEDDDPEDLNLVCFTLDSSLTVQDVLDTMEEDDLRLFAAAFLGEENRSDCLTGKNTEWVKKQYARAILQDKERLMLFMKGKAAEMFFFMMTAEVDEESMELDPEDLLDTVILENAQDLEEISVSLLHLYSLGICMPEMDSQGQIRSFSVSLEARRVYGKWLRQPGVRSRIRMYEDMEKLAVVLSCRYGVIEVDRLLQICQEKLGYRMRETEFSGLLEGRLEYFGRFEINTEDNVRYLSVFDAENMKKILRARKKYPELTYHTYDMPEISSFMAGNPYMNVNGYMELVNALWKSVQDVQVLGQMVRDIADMCMMESNPDTIIQEVRLLLNMAGRRMTKKLQDMIRRTAKDMPLATRYGYTLNELDKMKHKP